MLCTSQIHQLTQGYTEKKLETLDMGVIQTWMEECDCEEEEKDKIAKNEVWSNFQS